MSPELRHIQKSFKPHSGVGHVTIKFFGNIDGGIKGILARIKGSVARGKIPTE